MPPPPRQGVVGFYGCRGFHACGDWGFFRGFHGWDRFSRDGSCQGDPARPVRFEDLLTRLDPTARVLFRTPPDPSRLDSSREIFQNRL